MKEFCHRRVVEIFDLKVAVGICGVLLSIAAHELFHIIIHSGEIDSIHILPDAKAIVEVIFTPSTSYNLSLEEILAYTVTMVTLILTAMLIGDIHDARSEKTVTQTIFTKEHHTYHLDADPEKVFEQLATLLGVSPVVRASDSIKNKFKKSR